MIVVPYIQKAGLKLDRVMVCWDGSRTAARAVADAMPLLERAKAVEIVIVASERPKSDEVAGADSASTSPAMGSRSRSSALSQRDIDVANTLLSHAADTPPTSS